MGPFLCPALHVAPRETSSQPGYPACLPSRLRENPGFHFPPFPRLALNRYQLHLSWHRWLKTASAYTQGPQGLAAQDPR